MKFSTTLVLLLPASAFASVLDKRAVCNADNCNRAVLGTQRLVPNQASRLADCSSYAAVTVTPAPVTVTPFTTTITTTPAAKVKRTTSDGPITVVPTSTPVYASACSGTVRYSSACSCGGVTQTTNTVATPTVTATATVYVSSTSCSNPGTCSSYRHCAGFSNNRCYCGFDVNDKGICFQGGACQNVCTSNSDCSAGNACLKNSCCGFNTCAPVTVCANPVVPRAIFAARMERKRDDGCVPSNINACP